MCFYYSYNRQRPKCVKNQLCDVIIMREMRGEVGKKTLKKWMDNPSFLWLAATPLDASSGIFQGMEGVRPLILVLYFFFKWGGGGIFL